VLTCTIIPDVKLSISAAYKIAYLSYNLVDLGIYGTHFFHQRYSILF
jgi:hypothetical protein